MTIKPQVKLIAFMLLVIILPSLFVAAIAANINQVPSSDVLASSYGDRNGYTLTNVITLISNRQVRLILDGGDWLISNAVVVPTNIGLVIVPGARLSVFASSTSAIMGEFIAGPYEIFTGNGSVTGTASFLYRHSEWGSVSKFSIGAGKVTASVVTNQSFIMGANTTSEFWFARMTNLVAATGTITNFNATTGMIATLASTTGVVANLGVTQLSAGTASVYSISASTGSVSLLSMNAATSHVDNLGSAQIGCGTGSFYKINATTGVIQNIGATYGAFANIDFPFKATTTWVSNNFVPEITPYIFMKVSTGPVFTWPNTGGGYVTATNLMLSASRGTCATSTPGQVVPGEVGTWMFGGYMFVTNYGPSVSATFRLMENDTSYPTEPAVLGYFPATAPGTNGIYFAFNFPVIVGNAANKYGLGAVTSGTGLGLQNAGFYMWRLGK